MRLIKSLAHTLSPRINKNVCFCAKHLNNNFIPQYSYTTQATMALRESIDAQTNMSLQLARHVSLTKAKDDNLVFSPLSLHVVLSLITAGSSGGTKDELLGFLRSDSTDLLHKLSSEIASHVMADGSHGGGPKLQFANGVWVEKTRTLKHSFKEVVERIYKASVEQVDFLHEANKVVSEVNSWAENKTNGIIKDVLHPWSVDCYTRLIMANALYFKGVWDDPFDASETKEADFHLLNHGSVKVPFMTTWEKQFIGHYEECKVLRLPYAQGIDTNRQFSMYVFLPHETDGLFPLMDKLSSQPGFLNNHLPLRKVKVGNFMLQKFKISFGFEASSVLKKLGIRKAFLPGGLTEMVDLSVHDDLFVLFIFQKSFIDVKEDGTEAAFVTGGGGFGCCRPTYTPPVDFVADHPFIFLIREDTTGVVLAIGHVMNPAAMEFS